MHSHTCELTQQDHSEVNANAVPFLQVLHPVPQQLVGHLPSVKRARLHYKFQDKHTPGCKPELPCKTVKLSTATILRQIPDCFANMNFQHRQILSALGNKQAQFSRSTHRNGHFRNWRICLSECLCVCILHFANWDSNGSETLIKRTLHVTLLQLNFFEGTMIRTLF